VRACVVDACFDALVWPTGMAAPTEDISPVKEPTAEARAPDAAPASASMEQAEQEAVAAWHQD
jgi:hypothetical protein